MPLNIDWQQILLHLLNFAILAGGLYFLLYKPVKDFMAKREQYYKDLGEAAEKDRADAAALRKSAQEKYDAAVDEVIRMHQEGAGGLQRGAAGACHGGCAEAADHERQRAGQVPRRGGKRDAR